MVPVLVTIKGHEFTTALFPKDGSYIVPLKAKVRNALSLDEGDTVTVRLEVARPS